MFEWLSDGRILLEAIGGLFSHPAFEYCAWKERKLIAAYCFRTLLNSIVFAVLFGVHGSGEMNLLQRGLIGLKTNGYRYF
jgi:hypothetical protein